MSDIYKGNSLRRETEQVIIMTLSELDDLIENNNNKYSH